MTSSTPIRILTVDDHPVVREGIAGLVGVQPDMTLAAEGENSRPPDSRASVFRAWADSKVPRSPRTT
jgi:DNA-binding NarL/FixJ family response regulator